MKQSAIIRFLDKVKFHDGCWLWTGAKNHRGYGHLHYKNEYKNSKFIYAHRFSYMTLNGDVPVGLELDHLCRIRHCVNPDHLEAVTHRENSLRGTNPFAQNYRKTHCKWGHEFTEENTYPQKGIRLIGRGCRKCNVIRNRKSRDKIKTKLDGRKI